MILRNFMTIIPYVMPREQRGQTGAMMELDKINGNVYVGRKILQGAMYCTPTNPNDATELNC
jgi:hypothetical protein